jgi:hypothetical protein
VAAALAAQEATIHTALRLAAEGIAARERGENEAALAKLAGAAELRPDQPRILSHLAATQAMAGQTTEAIGTLGRLADLGVALPVENVEEFAALRGMKEFAAVAKRLAANERPKGKGDLVFGLREMTGLIEGIAWRAKTGEFFFGDVQARAVWRRAKDGKVARLTPEGDALLGVLGLAVDEARGALWAGTAAVPAMRGAGAETIGTAALTEIDLATGAIRRSVTVPTESDGIGSELGAVAVADDGTVYVVDRSRRASLWRLPAGADRLEVAARSEEFPALRGVAIAAGGALLVADRLNGLGHVEAVTGHVKRLEPPAGSTLVGLEGIAAGAGSFLIAVQAGLTPIRVLRIDCDAAFEAVRAVHVLESGQLAMAAPTQVATGPGGEFFLIGNGGWSRFEGGGAEPTPPRTVPIFKIATGAK